MPQLLFDQFFLSTIDCFEIFSYRNVITFIQSPNLVYRIFHFEKNSFVTNVETIDKNEKLLAHITPIGVNPDIAYRLPTLNPTPPIKNSERIINTFFLFKLFIFVLIIFTINFIRF